MSKKSCCHSFKPWPCGIPEATPGRAPNYQKNKVMNNPKIYVGTYAKYNAGDLSGAWLSLRDYATYEELIEACLELHSDEAEPELMIQDCEDFPDGLDCMESLSREEWQDVMDALNESESGPQGHFQIVDYSEKAVALIGDTRQISGELKRIGGRFNPRLTCGPGWIFPAKKRAELEALLAGNYEEAGRPETAANEGRKTLEEWAKGQQDPDYIMKAYESAVKLADGIVLFERPKIETKFCFRDEGPDYEFYKELGSDENLLRDYFIRENMDQHKIAEPDEGKDMYIVNYGDNRTGREYVHFCRWPEDLNLRREDTFRKATDEERRTYLAELARVRKAFRKRLDTYLKRYGVSKLHTWSYWADA